jgi:hypothetical protein
LKKTSCPKQGRGGAYQKNRWGLHLPSKSQKEVSLVQLERGLGMLLALLCLGLAVLLLALAVFKVLLLATLTTLYQGLGSVFGKLAKALCLLSLSKKDSFLSRH